MRVHSVQFSTLQSLSRVRLFASPWIAAHQASLSITNSRRECIRMYICGFNHGITDLHLITANTRRIPLCFFLMPLYPQTLLNVLTEGHIYIHSLLRSFILVVISLLSLSCHFMWDAQMALTSLLNWNNNDDHNRVRMHRTEKKC